MILVFGSSLYEHDNQNNLLQEALDRSGKEYVFINPLDQVDIARMELVQSGSATRLYVDNREIRPDVVYMSRMLRTDCFLNIPEDCHYPTLFRHAIQAFLTEIRFTLNDARWIPGTYEHIEKGEAKIPLMQSARKCGLTVPSTTTNSFRNLFLERKYRKSLGAPFVISFDSNEREEVAVTLVNKVEASDEKGLTGLPWQWQTFIQPTAQIRCVLVGNNVRAYKADIAQFNGQSLREAQEEGGTITWSACTLPAKEKSALVSLSQSMGLTLCCPEFLVSKSGEYIFIDLNPCGDWYGFLNDEESLTVAEMIVKTL